MDRHSICPLCQHGVWFDKDAFAESPWWVAECEHCGISGSGDTRTEAKHDLRLNAKYRAESEKMGKSGGLSSPGEIELAGGLGTGSSGQIPTEKARRIAELAGMMKLIEQISGSPVVWLRIRLQTRHRDIDDHFNEPERTEMRLLYRKLEKMLIKIGLPRSFDFTGGGRWRSVAWPSSPKEVQPSAPDPAPPSESVAGLSVRHVENNGELWQVATGDEHDAAAFYQEYPDGSLHKLQPLTASLVFALALIDISEITMENLKEVATRIRMLEIAAGPLLKDMAHPHAAARYITPEQVRRHIGLRSGHALPGSFEQTILSSLRRTAREGLF